MRLPDSALLGTKASLALSHCSKSNVTEGILLCSSDRDLRKMTESILWVGRHLGSHPAAVPSIICEMLADALDYKIEATWLETYQLETDSGQSGILLGAPVVVSEHGTALSPLLAQPPQHQNRQLALNQRAVGLAQLALSWVTYTEVLAQLVGHVEEFLSCEGIMLAATPRATPAAINDGKDNINRKNCIKDEQHLAVKQQISFVSQRAACLCRRAQYLRCRLEVQSTAVNNHLSLRLAENARSIAIASCMEGTAMKYLAVLGLIFVPAACIAVSILSIMPYLPQTAPMK